jgi:ketosteroid isomerase-like protein
MSATHSSAAAEVIALETAALKRWLAGDPSAFLEISDEDVVYFDPFLGRRLDGLAALTNYYQALRGKINAPRFEIVNPKTQAFAEAVVLTFNFVSWSESGEATGWNCTEVYARRGDAWKIVQTHWSFTGGRSG